MELHDLTAMPSAALAGSAGTANDKHCSDTAMFADSKRSQPSSAAIVDSKAGVAVAPQALGSAEENPSTPPAASPAQASLLHMRSNQGKPQQQTPARSAQLCRPISDAGRSTYQALQTAVASFSEAELDLLGVTKQEMMDRTAAMLSSVVNAHAMKPSSSPVGHTGMSAQLPNHPCTNSNSYCQAAGPAAGMTTGQHSTAAGTAAPPGQPPVDAPPHASPAMQDKGQTSSQHQDGLPGWSAAELEALEALQALSGPSQQLAPLSYQPAQQKAEASEVSPQLAAMAALFLEVWEAAAPSSGNGKSSKLDPCQINNSSGLAASPDSALIAAAAQAYEALVAAASQAPAGRYSRTSGRSSTPGSAHQAALQGSFVCNNNGMHSYHAAQLAGTPPGWTECYTGHATYGADMDGDGCEANVSSVPFGQFSPAQPYSSTGFVSKQPGGMRAVGGRKPVAGRSTAQGGRGGRGAARRKPSTSPSPATRGVSTAAAADGHHSCIKSVFPSHERVSASLCNRLSLPGCSGTLLPDLMI